MQGTLHNNISAASTHMKPYPLTKRSVTLTLLIVCSALGLFSIPVIFFMRSPNLLFVALFGTAACSIAALAYWRGYELVRYLLLITITLVNGLVIPEPFLTREYAIVIFVPPVIAMIVARPLWIIASAMLIQLCLLVRANWVGVYTDPLKLLVWLMIVSGMVLARLLTDDALRRAEEQTQLLNEERAHLAERVAERTAELLASNTKLLQANQLKDAFLANVSHELRTPLHVILGNSELLQEGVYGPLNTEARQSVRVINQQGEHLLALIESVLDLGTMETRTLALEPEPFLVREFCATCVRQIEPLAQRKDLAVLVEIDPALLSITADQRRLRQVLLCLLSNAVKFTPSGRRIGLRVAVDHTDRQIRFAVWDEGIGVSPQQQARIFEPFVQLDDGFTRQYEGIGIGLSLAQQLAILQGGTISVDSVVGQGATFTLVLPYAPPADPRQ